MNDDLTDRLATVLRLQSAISRLPTPGSDVERTLELALDLCLNQDREVHNSQFLERNVRRDAARSLFRGRRREQLANDRALSLVTIVTDCESAVGYDISSPDSSHIAIGNSSALVRTAVQAASDLGPWGGAFIRELLDGATVDEASRSAGISRATGFRARRRLADALRSERESAV